MGATSALAPKIGPLGLVGTWRLCDIRLYICLKLLPPFDCVTTRFRLILPLCNVRVIYTTAFES